MLFNSYLFISHFLPISILCYFLLVRLVWTRLATAALIAASLVFYTLWDWRGALILLSSIAFNYLFGCLLKGHPRPWFLFLGIAGNVAALGTFKYTNFLIDTLNAITHQRIPGLHLVLPLGISFFTFTQISFLVDTYRGETKDLNLWRYVLFVSFFPYVASGPIVIQSEMAPQFSNVGIRRWIRANVHGGLMFFTIGLAKKVLVADLCAPWANAVFDASSRASCALAWLGALAYTMQLYFDFSGYTDMAIGLALMFNIHIPDNFNSPYKSDSIIDFWQRWHISLSQFLRDYIYMPLAFSLRAPQMQIASLFLTMLIAGLWHGAGWTFVLWGAYHGLLLVIAHLWKLLRKPLPAVAARSLTFGAIVVGWVLFRSKNVAAAFSMLVSMFDPRSLGRPIGKPLELAQIVTLLALLVFVNVAPTTRDWIESRDLKLRHAIFAGVLMFACLLGMRTTFSEHGTSMFLYFRF